MKSERGFTLVEMAIVILIIAGLLLLMITNIGGVTDSVNETTDDGIIQTVETQKVIYEVDKNEKGVSAEDLNGAGYITDKQLQSYNDAITRRNAGD